jgi:glycosyltransferase involved in cell wall biosynthesis
MIFPDQTEMAGLYARSDGLLLPFGFGDRNVVKYRYSVPTKLPAYMLSGSPIFACVPGDSVVAGLMNDNCAGFVVSDAEDIEALSRSIEKFCADEHLRRRIGLNARDFAAQKMSGDVVRPGFIKALSEII